MMRGPRSKGHCQVAVSCPDSEAPPASPGRGSPAGPAGTLRGFVRMAQVRAARPRPIPLAATRTSALTAARAVRRLCVWRGPQQMAQNIVDRPVDIKQLKCCLTFVNVSWQSIVNDVSQVMLGAKTPFLPEES